jgi:PAS domain S-box-containing protein
MLGYDSPEDLKNNHASQMYLDPHDRQSLLDQLRLNKRVDSFEIAFVTKTGQPKPVLIAARVDGDVISGTVIDITRRKQMEDELAKEKSKLAVTLRSIGDGVITADLDGNVRLINATAEALTGWEQEQGCGKPLADVFHIVDATTRMACEDPAEKILDQGSLGDSGCFTNPTILIASDGEERSITYDASPMIDQSDNVIGVVLVFRDVTDIRKAEKLKDGFAQLTTILDSLPSSIYIMDPDSYELVYANTHQNTMGKELIGGTCYHELYSFNEPCPFCTIDFLKENPGMLCQWEHYDPETDHHFQMSDKLIQWPDDRWLRFESAVDVTARKKAEESIQKQKRELESIFSNVSDVLYFLSVEANDRYRFLKVNQSFLDVTGLSESQIIGKYVDEIIPEPSLNMVRGNYKQAIEENRTVKWEEITPYPAGKKYGEVTITPIYDNQGICTNLIGSVHDLTEIRLLNDDLERRVEERTAQLTVMNKELEEARLLAESANKAKSDFLANMSHELRTPLNAILGFTELVKNQVLGPLNDEQVDSLGEVHAAGQHLTGLIGDLLDLSRIEAGKLELQKDEVSIQDLIEKCSRMLAEKASAHSLTMHVVVPEDLEKIVADERRIMEVVLNLLGNALKYTPDGGEVGIRAEDVGDELQITVWDTGIGIGEKDMNLLFQPFQRIETMLTKNIQGTGLGLNYSKKLVELHGGRIWVESEEGMGSRFTFSLPRR